SISIFYTICLLFSSFLFTKTCRLIRNIFRARQLKLPYIVVPVDQSSLAWILVMMPLKPLLEPLLPTSIYRRLKLTTFDWEWQEKRRPFDDYAASSPQDDGSSGSGRTFVMAGGGSLLEVWTCDSELAIDVLSRAADFQLSKVGTTLLGAIGPSVLSANGKAWSGQRRILQQVINERIARLAFDESRDQTMDMLDEVFSASSSSSSSSGTITTAHAIDAESVLGLAKRLAINVLSATVMGISSPWNAAADDQEPSRASRPPSWAPWAPSWPASRAGLSCPAACFRTGRAGYPDMRGCGASNILSRWLDHSGILFRPPRGAYLAWGAGRRVCPGQKMSQVELAAFVMTLLRRCYVRGSPLPDETETQMLDRLDAAMMDSEFRSTLHMCQYFSGEASNVPLDKASLSPEPFTGCATQTAIVVVDGGEPTIRHDAPVPQLPRDQVLEGMDLVRRREVQGEKVVVRFSGV
ncbi:hypothetical protein PspLS_03347, partial [Pyricularia sp. CBS 133598]